MSMLLFSGSVKMFSRSVGMFADELYSGRSVDIGGLIYEFCYWQCFVAIVATIVVTDVAAVLSF